MCLRVCYESISNEVTIPLLGDPHELPDILIHARDNNLKHISEILLTYDAPLHAPILWNGQDAYHFNVPQIDSAVGE